MAVADTFIRELVNRLVQLVEENRLSLIEIKDQIYDLVNDLKSLNATLEQASKNESAKYVLKDVVDKIRNVISDAEDAICMYTVERKKHTSKANFIQAFAGEIQSIRDRVKKIQQDHAQAFKALIYDLNRGPSIQELINRLVQVVEEKASLTIGIKDQIDDLVAELEVFNAYLKQASKNQSARSKLLKDVVDKIRNLVNDAEDAIDRYTVVTKKYKDKGAVLRFMEKVSYYAKVDDSAREIQRIGDEVKKIRQEKTPALPALIDDPNTGQTIIQRMRSDELVDLTDLAKEISPLFGCSKS